jgi:hypothetical protein
MRRQTLGAIALTLMALAGAATSVGAANPGAVRVPANFSTPVQVVSGSFGVCTECPTPGGIAMVVDSTHAVDIAATGNGGLWFISNRSGTWKHHLILANPTGRKWRDPSIAVDGKDRVYIAFGQTGLNHGLLWSFGTFMITDKGRTRGTFPAAPIKVRGPVTGDPSIQVFGKRIDIAFDRDCTCMEGEGPTAQYLRSSTDGGKTWTLAQITPEGYTPELRLNSQGLPLAAYWTPGHVGYAIGAAPTGSFSRSSLPNSSTFEQPQLAVGADDRAQIVYDHVGGTLRYERQTAGGWSSPDTIAPARGSFAFDLDSNGHPRVVQAAKNGIHEFSLVGGNWVDTPIVAGVKDAVPVVVRGLQNGKIEVAYLRAGGGLWVTRG